MTVKCPFQPALRLAAYLHDIGHEEQEFSVGQQEAAIHLFT
jgi:HD superfamily phosphodiesterase